LAVCILSDSGETKFPLREAAMLNARPLCMHDVGTSVMPPLQLEPIKSLITCSIIIIIIIIIIMSIVPLGTYVVYKSSPAFSTPGDKPEITPAVLPTFIQCSSSP
jgi:hypothetical protein